MRRSHAQDALCAAPPLRVLPVDVLRITDAFAACVEVRIVVVFARLLPAVRAAMA